MKLPHAHSLYIHGTTSVHRTPAAAKLVCLVAFALVVAMTPRDAGMLLAAEAALVVGVAVTARLGLGTVASRLIVEVPFLAFVVFLPFFGGGERVDVLGISLSVEGAWAAWAIIVKASLCLGASIVVTSTTAIPDLLSGLARLHVPSILVSITGFMVRYVDLVVAEWRRMRMAMVARGYEPRSIVGAGPLAGAAAGVFIRSHERGERVYTAMLARGYGEAAR